EINFKENGIMQKRASDVLNDAYSLLKTIEKEGMFKSIEKGIFADIKRPLNGGKGLEGVIEKETSYFNPFIDIMKRKLSDQTSGGK
ncbi:MAG: D-lysine 5,6-aminomutase subunit alpha, partial [archaeon]|nr:D-lysine 5,6-aminomutase subunit alpha [archaeon]